MWFAVFPHVSFWFEELVTQWTGNRFFIWVSSSMWNQAADQWELFQAVLTFIWLQCGLFYVFEVLLNLWKIFLQSVHWKGLCELGCVSPGSIRMKTISYNNCKGWYENESVYVASNHSTPKMPFHTDHNWKASLLNVFWLSLLWISLWRFRCEEVDNSLLHWLHT